MKSSNQIQHAMHEIQITSVSCPFCKQTMKRVERKWIDKILNGISLGKQGYKRYECNNCNKEITL